jgi:hypothetical protein
MNVRYAHNKENKGYTIKVCYAHNKSTLARVINLLPQAFILLLPQAFIANEVSLYSKSRNS